MISNKKMKDPCSLQSSLNKTTLNPENNIVRNISRSIKNYKPPRHNHMSFGDKTIILGARNNSLAGDKFGSFMDPKSSTQINNMSAFGCENDLSGKSRNSEIEMYKPFQPSTPLNQYNNKLIHKKANFTNF